MLAFSQIRYSNAVLVSLSYLGTRIGKKDESVIKLSSIVTVCESWVRLSVSVVQSERHPWHSSVP